ncbi:ECF transporter S component [Peribacillus glennii]|uniref:Riboflavin transporter n=1 Tax=Peribacillus glennii TaxID=2303991 RepID=A0A372LFT8_9BACI|nr:ECF transporter S component [Peribacillus glennii]RFU65161.1 ECF transporter S component [Peribacillus glennii]
MSIYKLAFLGMIGALSFVLMWFGFPILPAAPYLKFEPSDVPLMIATIAYGPIAGILALTVKNLMYFLLHGSNIFGIFMNFMASATFLLVVSFVNKKMNMAVAGGAGAVAMALVMIPLNLIIVPLEFGIPFEQVSSLLLPVYIPFNLIKGCFNTFLFILLWSVLKNRAVVQLKFK